jgi:hypothetical protein
MERFLDDFRKNRTLSYLFAWLSQFNLYLSVSVLLSLFYSAPIFAHALSEEVMPLELANDTLYYLTKIQSWKESFGLPLNPYHENRFHDISNYTFIVESSLAVVANVTNSSVNLVYGVITLISFNVNFYLIMKLSSRIGLPKRFAFLVFLIAYIILVPYAPYRPISPQLNLIIYLVICLATISFFDPYRSKNTSIWLCVLQLVLWFIYPYFALLSSITILLLNVERYRRNYHLVFRNILILNAIPAMPWVIINYLSSPQSSRETALRTGLVESNHYPGAFKILLGTFLLALCILIFNAQRRDLTLNKFLIFQGLAILIVSNSQVVTGKSLQFESHYILVFWLNTSLILFSLFRRFVSSLMQTLTVLLIFVLTGQAVTSYFEQVNRVERIRTSSYERNLWNYVQENVGKSEIISAPLDISQGIVYSTNRKVLATTLSRLYIMSDEELTRRVLLNHYPNSLKEPIPEEVYVSIFGIKFREAIAKNLAASRIFGNARLHSAQISREEEIATDYLLENYSKLDVPQELNNFGVDWIIRHGGEIREFEKWSSRCASSVKQVGPWGICRW